MKQHQHHPPPPTAAHQAINGPRSKCDQVVYEAIAKSCEIVVRGRCDVPSSGASPNGSGGLGVSTSGLASGAVIVGSDRPVHGIYSPQRGFHKQFSAAAGLGGGSGAAGGGGGSNGGRFNLEVEEVSGVRYVVQCSFHMRVLSYIIIFMPIGLDCRISVLGGRTSYATIVDFVGIFV